MGGDFTEHHTRSQGPPPEYTEMAADNSPPAHKCSNKPGFLAAAWINKLYQSSLSPSLACDPESSHSLRSLPTQSVRDQGLLVCICEKCKRTFTIQVEAPGGRCRPEIERMHHLVEEQFEQPQATDQLHPIISKNTSRCSATVCSLAVHIEVCEPRLARKWEAELMDREAVQARLKELVASDPTRYQDLMSTDKLKRLLPAYYLQAYLRDALADPPPEKPTRVSARNKFFSVNFADSLQPLLDLLGFQRIVEDDEQFLLLPSVDPPLPSIPTTPHTSRRAWLEVIRAHLYCLLLDEHLQEQLTQDSQLPPAADTKAWLTKVLDAEYNKTTYPNWTQYPEEAFDVLGAQKDMSEILLWYAAISQNQTNPPGREAVFQAVTQVTGGRETRCAQLGEFLEAEQMHAVTELSKKDPQTTTPLSKAFRTFQLPETCSDHQLVVEWKRLMTASQWDRTTSRTARHDLFIIGKTRDSYELMQTAVTFDSGAEAADFLGVDLSMDPVQIVYETVASDKDAWFDKTIVAAAARELSKSYANHPEVHQLLAYATDLESPPGDPAHGGLPTTITTNIIGAGKVDVTLPVGLQNIRNTCYLNSILQYFYTVTPVRDVILNWEEYKLEPTEANISSRRLGGSGSALDKGEAFLAAKFVEEMRNLFTELQNSTVSSVRPQQRLAIAALKDANQLVKGNVAEKAVPFVGPLLPPPELPPRPSPKPPAETSEAPTAPTVSVNAVADNADTNSNVSSVTLVDQKDGEDNTYVEISNSVPPAIPAKERSALEDDEKDRFEGKEPTTRGRSATRDGDSDVNMTGMHEAGDESAIEDTRSIEEKIEAALNDKAVTGTDQQDIEEVMGNILEHLHGAIRPLSTDEHTGKQTDIITETFYWSSKKYIRDLDLKTGKASSAYRSIPDLSRWITAFPANEGKIDLYSALDSSFDREHQEVNEETTETYTSITKPSPILHVYIQRSQNVNGRLGRNNNVVEIPEVLYLDRYMDGGEESHVFKERQRSWDLKSRLRALNTPPAVVNPTKKVISKGKDVQETGFEVIDGNFDEFADAVMSIDSTGEGDGEEEYVSILDAETRKMLEDHQLLPSQLEGNGTSSAAGSQEATLVNLDHQASKRARAKVEEEKDKIKGQLSTLFSDMKSIAYRLHAVICHGGGLGGGHYWVWIFDFRKRVWRKYNDERVEEYSDSTKVLTDLNNSHDPYYLAYVREDKVNELVAIPERSASSGEGQNGENTDQVGTSRDADHKSPSRETSHPQDRMMQSLEFDADADDEPDVMHVENRGD
ncbi:ubiquitin-specific protease ubp2 [Gnomoniopsis sp. IMI 355080]|nr:ubiquitin-specific protease ubp2 [Gnomoniopsis sp. IMI 355080]